MYQTKNKRRIQMKTFEIMNYRELKDALDNTKEELWKTMRIQELVWNSGEGDSDTYKDLLVKESKALKTISEIKKVMYKGLPK
jgi:hypothetical protein